MAYIGSGLTRFNTADDLTVTDDAEIKGDITTEGDLKVEVASGGIYTITGTDTATNRTLTLPDEAGTVLTSASDITQNSGPAFSAYLSSDQSITSQVFTKVALNVEEFDTDGAYDNVTNYRFQPTVAGYYMITGYITFDMATASVEFLSAIYKNGSIFKRGSYSAINTSQNQGSNASALIHLNGSTDYVELYGYLDASGSIAFQEGNDETFFQGVLVRTA